MFICDGTPPLTPEAQGCAEAFAQQDAEANEAEGSRVQSYLCISWDVPRHSLSRMLKRMKLKALGSRPSSNTLFRAPNNPRIRTPKIQLLNFIPAPIAIADN